ncbi:restriction endonuclease (plasmid) [Haloarcula marismortui ATCC 33800]|uniref:Restriction endonuclease n=1 Tax=Haloarcula marismortui ATCC 33800 TaxID=662476 RepID=M0JCT4_9EURY|nr:restriction system mrr-like protein [Haloarcula sinaiiensis ATCC 33800]QUJ74775.1 restriction endonuclease [Haloarcula sinaiiensis ATCC 33800]
MIVSLSGLSAILHKSVLEYSYPYEYYAAGPSRVTLEDGIHRCVHCETSGVDETYTYCPNCGAIACNSHIKTERLEDEPVCTGCAVTERFSLKTKYFYNKENLEAFREEYAEMGLHEKAMENKLLAGGGVVVTLLVVVGLLVTSGVI